MVSKGVMENGAITLLLFFEGAYAVAFMVYSAFRHNAANPIESLCMLGCYKHILLNGIKEVE